MKLVKKILFSVLFPERYLRVKRKLFDLLPYLFIFVFVIILFYPVFRGGYITRGDHPIHLHKSFFIADHVLPEQHWIDGWCPWDYGGYDISLTYPPLLYLLVSLLHFFSFLSVEVSYNIIFILIYVFLGWSVFYCFSDGFGKNISFLFSLIFLLSNVVYSVHVIGMTPFMLSAVFFFLYFKCLKDFHLEMTVEKLFCLILLLSLITLSHVFTLVVAWSLLFSSLFIKIINKGSKKEILRKYLFILITPFSICLYYVWNVVNLKIIFSQLGAIVRPYLFQRPLLSNFLWDILGFYFLWDSHNTLFENIYENIYPCLFCLIDILSICGIIYYFFFFKERKKSSFTSVLIIFSLFMVSFHALSFLPPSMKIFFFKPEYLTVRYIIFLLFVLMYFACLFLECDYIKKNKNIRLVICIILILFCFSETCKRVISSDANMGMFEKISESENLEKLWIWIWENNKIEHSRVVYQNTNYSGNPEKNPFFISHIMALSSVETGVNQIVAPNCCNNESNFLKNITTDQNRLFGVEIEKISDSEVVDYMKTFNAEFIVSCEPALQKKLQSSGYFTHAASFPPFSIFRVRGVECSEMFEFSEPVSLFNFNEERDDRIVMDFENISEENTLQIKISYHPYWRAYINGNEVLINKNKNGLMEIDIFESGRMKLELEYSSFNYFTVFISGLSIIVLICSWIYFLRKKSGKDAFEVENNIN